jgi:hypothetical protein
LCRKKWQFFAIALNELLPNSFPEYATAFLPVPPDNSEECGLQKSDPRVYVLEANLAFAGGMTIPLMSEFLSYAEGDTDTKNRAAN